MKDSYNYASFSNALFVRKRGKQAKQKRTLIIEADELALSEDYCMRHYPPYLRQDIPLKSPQNK